MSELNDYIRSARENGQGDDIPVVEMGMIVDSEPRFGWVRGVAVAASVFLVLGAVAYTAASTREIRIVSSDLGSEAVARLVSEEGGRVFSVMKEEEDGSYKVRVLTFRKMSSFLDRLRENKEVDRVELEE